MTDQNRDPQNDLPSFSVNVVPTHKITAAHLGALLERYREGQIEPLVFGEDNKPEAAVIPFAAFVRLLKYDRASTTEEQAELARRIREADASDDPGLSLQELGDELGEPARSLIRKAIHDDGR